MDPQCELENLLLPGRSVRIISEGIYSAISDNAAGVHHYDRIASVYDHVVGTKAYNKVMWGCSPDEYINFAVRAVDSANGTLLDAGCGSLLFTAEAYVETGRTIIAFDQSLAMLERARDRLIRIRGSLPDHVHLVQADLSDIPFRPGSFETALCMNLLHQYEDAVGLISDLNKLLLENGRFFITSLVFNHRTIGDWYLKVLHSAGEFIRPRSADDVKELSEALLGKQVTVLVKGNMAFIRAGN